MSNKIPGRIDAPLPDDSTASCRECTCGSGGGHDKLHTQVCEFYIDYADALTELVYADDACIVSPRKANCH